ncbi:MAG TPA: PH domain-containing protein [Candidatus Binataceae bacterium]|nr:PH domain-containing protein [Candidatus Binataceae bacterium]
MRCPQCGSDSAPDAQFCARCGTRLLQPKPADKREYALMRVNPAWWHFIGAILSCCVLIVAGFIVQLNSTNFRHLGLPLLGLGAIGLLSTALRRHFISWSLTSERVIENKGILARHRREMELADVRSVDVERRFMQRAMGLGDIVIASAASADYAIKLYDVPDPEGVAETLRRARLKRLA